MIRSAIFKPTKPVTVHDVFIAKTYLRWLKTIEGLYCRYD